MDLGFLKSLNNLEVLSLGNYQPKKKEPALIKNLPLLKKLELITDYKTLEYIANGRKQGLEIIYHYGDISEEGDDKFIKLSLDHPKHFINC